MTAAPWDTGPCAWPDDDELERQLAEAEADYWSRAGLCRVPAQAYRDTETIDVIEGIL